jgi:hypothetical protein
VQAAAPRENERHDIVNLYHNQDQTDANDGNDGAQQHPSVPFGIAWVVCAKDETDEERQKNLHIH